MRLWDTAAQYPLLESIQGGTIHQWLWNWKAVSYPHTVWKKEFLLIVVLAYRTRNHAM